MGQSSSSRETSDTDSPTKNGKIVATDVTDATNPRLMLGEKPQLSEKQRELVKETWKYIHSDVQKVGVVTFVGLFETHPEVKETFVPYMEMESDDLYVNTQLRAHALRVMTTVEKVLARIDSPDKMDKLLIDLGSRHAMYKSKAKHMQYFGPQILKAIRPSLAEHWSEEVEESWKCLFDYISYTMQCAMFDT